MTHLAWFGRNGIVWGCGNRDGVSVLHLQNPAQGLVHSRNSLNMSRMSERDKAHFPSGAQDKTRPGGMRAQPWTRPSEGCGFVRAQDTCKGVGGVMSINAGCGGW